MEISQKKKDALWGAINDAVLDARIEIAKLLRNVKNGEAVDTVLFKLSISAPEKALSVFEK